MQSAPGAGTTFRVLFPADARPAEAVALPATDPDAWHALGSALVIDDEPGVLEVLQAMLEEIGFEVVAVGAAASGGSRPSPPAPTLSRWLWSTS